MKISEILKELGKDGLYSTDKHRDRKYAHCYGLAYDHIFKPYSGKIDILEIGIETGASLEAWRRFFPEANITGLEIDESKIVKRLPDVNYIIGDIKDFKPEQLWDIVIDDGSHKRRDVIHTVNNIKLKVGGTMIIEDCQAPDHWYASIQKRTNYSIERIDLRGVNGQRDDYLMVLRNYGYAYK